MKYDKVKQFNFKHPFQYIKLSVCYVTFNAFSPHTVLYLTPSKWSSSQTGCHHTYLPGIKLQFGDIYLSLGNLANCDRYEQTVNRGSIGTEFSAEGKSLTVSQDYITFTELFVNSDTLTTNRWATNERRDDVSHKITS